MADKIVVLNHGQIEQIDTPQNIYHNPNSIFVATFMGSPPMNILNAQIKAQKIILADGSSHHLPNCPDIENIKIGIRPEKIKLARNMDSDKHWYLPFVVDVVEDLGAERLVYGRLAECDFIWATELIAIKAGDELTLSLPIKHLRYFDSQTEKALNFNDF